METLNEAIIPVNSNMPSDKINETSTTSECVIFKRSKSSSSYFTNRMDKEGDTKDVTIIVDNQKLTVPKNVLIYNCDYFHTMLTYSFKEGDKGTIEITDISYETLNTLIGFFRTSELVITVHNAQDLLIASNKYLILDVQEACINYFKIMMDVENCINMKDLANFLYLDDLHSLCMTYIEQNLRLVGYTKEFMTLKFEEIMRFIKNDDLFVKEDQVYDIVMNWIKYDPAARYKYTPDLLWYVRMPLILNTYQGVIKVNEFRGAGINNIGSFRTEYRKPFRKGILLICHSEIQSVVKWYDATVDQWHSCIIDNCQCKNFQIVLRPQKYLCTCILLDDGRLFAAGGYSYNLGSNSAYIFDTNNNTWDWIGRMITFRIKPYVVQIGWKVFVIGGASKIYENFLPQSDIEYYDLREQRWFSVHIKIGICSDTEDSLFVACVNDLIYTISHEEAGIYNYQTNSWQSIPKLPERKISSAVCSLNNNIYIIGGKINGICCKSVCVYRTEDNKWVSVADLNIPRSNAGAVAMNGLIYVFGGMISENCYSNGFEIYNPLDDKWVISKSILNPGKFNIDAIVVEKSCILYQKLFKEASSNVH